MSDTNQGGASTTPLFSEMASDEDMMELVEFFVDELQQRINSLGEALSSSNMDDLKTLSHQLKGAAGGYGFPAISVSAAEVEQCVMEGEAEVSDLNEKVEALINLCRRASI